MIRLISFDLQGVVSDATFSDTFWLEELPKLYAKRHNVDVAVAKRSLGDMFKAMGKYDLRYYDDAYWGAELGFSTADIITHIVPQPRVEKLLIEYIAGLSLPVVLLSTTTNRFIDYELGLNKQYFNKIYSCVDDFSTGGKTADVFGAIAREWGVKPNEIVHIGDNQEMDIDNALKAGVRAILYTGNPGAVVAQINHLLDGVDEGR
ncbi:hypothetical protein L336_0458 [Candidatus Saccharimonas aalborgensis]|jgi:putative hydrolase of the HAD superfamily|uniref:Uncharacterized protein n=1 Tax=Candidatus Saccharimonas aalborgensis TaxID=1332188 RepID=R4PMM3_9BACT|nr:HAD family hydrolase [Candidatus Saccharimonas aalborgensis]AGL62164.1 hypothetical protein L336_0458 [Candidatus Saccharimonas aalborgensis]QQR50932.1 MAG: HAD family hydrolase [Candidatus Saccharibacteria bacterium]QQS68678.1 MAG: HAD family hydrolase [Candidatus Saccharibacteria bacterium]